MRLLRTGLLLLMLAYWLTICVLTHVRHLPAAARQVSDKLAHFVAYGLLAGLLCLVLWVFRPTWRLAPVAVLGAAMIYGALDEWTQPWFGRTCDIHDWLFDVAGTATALAVVIPLRWVIARRRGAGAVAR